MHPLKCSSFVFVFIIIQMTTEGRNFQLKKLEMCDLTYDYPLKFEATLKVENEVQYMNMSAVFNTPFGQSEFMNLSLDFSKTGKTYLPLFRYVRSDVCDFLNNDLGPFWFDIEKQFAVPPRTCPLRMGRYNIRNYEMPFSKLQFPLPSGLIRGIVGIYEQQTNRVHSCIYTLMQVN